MQIKTQKQVLALQNKVQKIADKLNKEVVVIAKGVQHIQVQAGTAYLRWVEKLSKINQLHKQQNSCQK
jgi:hypothetical protein